MTLEEFIRNPVGKGDASINKELLVAALDHKYTLWVETKKSNISFTAYRDDGSSDYYLWFVVPSETARTNTYDIIFRFFDPNMEHRKDLSVSKYDIQVFSNVPLFAYTYAYVYNKNDMIIKELKPKLGEIFFTQEPVVRNRQGLVMYDKYIYYVAKYIIDHKYLNRVALETKCKLYTKKKLFLTKVRSLKQIKSEYEIAKQKLKQPSKSRGTGIAKPKMTSTRGQSGISVVSKTAHNMSNVSKTVPRKSQNKGIQRINKNTKRKRGVH